MLAPCNASQKVVRNWFPAGMRFDEVCLRLKQMGHSQLEPKPPARRVVRQKVSRRRRKHAVKHDDDEDWVERFHVGRLLFNGMLLSRDILSCRCKSCRRSWLLKVKTSRGW